jgi:hypothetical protein
VLSHRAAPVHDPRRDFQAPSGLLRYASSAWPRAKGACRAEPGRAHEKQEAAAIINKLECIPAMLVPEDKGILAADETRTLTTR